MPSARSMARCPVTPRIFLRPSPAQAIPLEMLKRLEQEQVRAEAAEAAEAKGRRGPFPQRVTFTSCSVHAQFMFYPFWVLYISLYILFVSLCDTIFRTFNVQIVQCPAPPSSTCFDFRHVSIFSLKPAPAGRTRRRLQCSFNPMPPR